MSTTELQAVVIFRMRGREHMASTGLGWLQRYAKDLKDGGNLLMLADIEPGAIEELEKTGTMDLIGKENVFAAQPELGASVDEALEAAQKWLAGRQASSAEEESGDKESDTAEAE